MITGLQDRISNIKVRQYKNEEERARSLNVTYGRTFTDIRDSQMEP